jgi:hypothetical protein
MLFAVLPVTCELTTILPAVNAVAILFIRRELSFVGSMIRPLIKTETFHVVIVPLATETSPVKPEILT